MADLTADAEGASVRIVPRLDNDLALPDQLRVMVADLVAVAASPSVYQRAVALVNDTVRRL